MSLSDSPSPSLSEATSVRPIACNPCRQRRSQCSKEHPKCRRCREVSIDCVYEEARKITINERYLRDLEIKAKAYEDAIAAATSQGATSMSIKNRASAHVDDDDEVAEGNALLEDFGRIGFHEPEIRPSASLRSSFKGPAHSDMFLQSMKRLPNIKYPDDVSLDLDTGFYEPTLLVPRRLSVRSHVRLPPIDTARRYYAAQYTYIGTIFSFSDPVTFEETLVEAYRSPPPDLADSAACLRYAKILVILAFGQLYSVNQWIDFKGPPGFEYFSHALQLLPDVHEEGSILCVETLALIGYFMQNMNRRDAAFLYIGIALRMAISLGLHQEVADPAVGPEEREHRRRVWWSIYSLDRILSVKSGNPITIQDEDIGVAPPSRLPSEPEYCPAVVLRHYTELSRILGEVNKHIFRKGGGPGGSSHHKSGAQLMASVKGIMLTLSRWHRELPEPLRFDPARLAMSRESVTTLVHYYQCINMTARPLLFHVVQKRLRGDDGNDCNANNAGDASDGKRKGPADRGDWKKGLSQTTVSVIEMCVSAAQDSIKLMSIAAQRDLVATYGYMDSEHIFSAAIVLLMVCIAFPPDPLNMQAMNMGLSLLRGMAERGNSYIGARYQLLDRLRSMIYPTAATAAPAKSTASAFSGASTTPAGNSDGAAASSTLISPSSPPLASSPPLESAAQAYITPRSTRSSLSSAAAPSNHHGHVPSASPAITMPNTGLQQNTLVFGPIPVTTGSRYGHDVSAAALGSAAGNFSPFALSSNAVAAGGFSPSSLGSGGGSYTAAAVAAGSFSYPAGTSIGTIGVGGGMFAPGLRLGDVGAVEEMFFDVNMSNVAGDDDFGLWEAGFADPAAYDLVQLTQAAEMAVDQQQQHQQGGDSGRAGFAGGSDDNHHHGEHGGEGMQMNMEL